jgi:hypothetical protein
MWLNFKVLSQHLPEGTEENHKKSYSIAGLWAEILTWGLPYMKQEH